MSNRAIWGAGLGQCLTWGSAFGTEINSLPAADSVLSSIVVANGTALDLYADVSFSLTGTTAAGSPFIGLYLFPLNQDGTTYGDGSQTTSASSTLPTTSYLVSSIVVKAGVSAAAFVGSASRIILPPGSFSFVLYNGTGNALSGSGNSVKYRTYVENLNG